MPSLPRPARLCLIVAGTALLSAGCTRRAVPTRSEEALAEARDQIGGNLALLDDAPAAIYADALRGDVVAQRRLGLMYEGGIGVPHNLTAAIDWLLRAAEQNDCAAQHALGLIFLGRPDRPADIDEAARWLRRAIDNVASCTS